MNRLALIALVSALAGCPASGTAVVTTGPAPSRPDPGYRPAPSPQWDSTGWTLLGSQTVDGRADRDVIQVAKRARWDKLTLVVSESDLELVDLDVEFANGEKWSPKLAYTFREGQRTRALDLPGDDRHIAKITLLYKNLPGGGRARVEVYAKDIKNPTAYNPTPSGPGYTPPTPAPRPVEPPPPPPKPEWDPAGWTLLGSQTVEGKKDKDTYPVGNKFGKLDRLTVVVKDSDLEMVDFVVVFDGGNKFEPKIKYTFREGERTRAIDLPDYNRNIKQIQVRYANLPGGGKARVEIYGKNSKSSIAGFDPTGWNLLGTQMVDGKRDRDVYQVGAKAGRIDQITVVVSESDLEMDDFIVTFANNEKWEPKLRHVFKEGSKARAIDLPASDRKIKSIELRYKNLPGGGKAKVEIYGRDTKQGKNPKK